MTQLRLINDRSGPTFLASSRCFTVPSHASHLPSGGSSLHLLPLGCPASFFQTKSLAALAGSNAASRISQRLSRHGSDRHKEPGPAQRRWRRATVRAMAAQIYILPGYRFGKRPDKVPTPLSCQAEAMSSLDFPLPEVHGSLCPPVVLQACLLAFTFTSPWCHSELTGSDDTPMPYPHATQAEAPVTSWADTLCLRVSEVVLNGFVAALVRT